MAILQQQAGISLSDPVPETGEVVWDLSDKVNSSRDAPGFDAKAFQLKLLNE